MDEVIPFHATHITVHKDCTVVLSHSISRHHSNLVEVICHDGVERIEIGAFGGCPSLRRVIMRGVKIVEEDAFNCCKALTEVECGKLEIIGVDAFGGCSLLRGINLPSARIIEEYAFCFCKAMTDVKFGSNLERIEERAFWNCTSLERITVPLKNGIITTDDIFSGCVNLRHVDLVEGELHDTIAALQLEVWRSDMYEEIDSINQVLPNARAGYYIDDDDEDDGEKAQAIRRWIRAVLRKFIQYKAEHQRLLDEEVAPTLQHALPHDIAVNSVLPFLELPPHTLEGENHGFELGDEEEEDDDDGEQEGQAVRGNHNDDFNGNYL